jgi:hypothetical protein
MNLPPEIEFRVEAAMAIVAALLPQTLRTPVPILRFGARTAISANKTVVSKAQVSGRNIAS